MNHFYRTNRALGLDDDQSPEHKKNLLITNLVIIFGPWVVLGSIAVILYIVNN
jgi:hypothetical protein